MAELWYGHFDSTQDDPRMLLAEDWARFIRCFLGDGIRNGGTNLQISTPTDGMVVRMDEGFANIQGYIFECKQDLQGRYYPIEIQPAHPSLNRIDRVVLRLDRTIQTRTIEPVVLLGAASTNPVAPGLTRNNNVWEISLAQVRVPAAAVNIRPEYITDERLNTALCGIIDSLISADTQGLYNDFHAAFLAKILEFTQEFNRQLSSQDTDYKTLVNSFNSKIAEINNWYQEVKNDIAALQTFDFDNLSELPGCTRATTFLTSGIREQITYTASGRLLATRETTFNANGTITVVITVYKDDGVTVSKRSSTTTAFNADGSIGEVIIDG